MEPIEAQSTNKQGEISTYTGVRISDLLSKAGPKDGATTVVFAADDRRLPSTRSFAAWQRTSP